jgi:hypothetical protein
MVALHASASSPSLIFNRWIQFTAGIVPMIAIANLQCALKNLPGEDNYALA